MRRTARTSRGRRTTAFDPTALADRRARALEEPLDVQLRTAEPYPLLEVRNPIHGTEYLVMLPEYPAQSGSLCTCTDFARRGLGTCKHIEAGVRWVSDHPDAPPLRAPDGPHTTGVWKKVDQRLASSVRDLSTPSRRWRRAGAVLFEPSDAE